MSYKVIIPTYERSELIVKKTLASIQKTNLDLSELYIFVADTDDQARKYAGLNIGKLIIGKRGLPNQHNFIQRMFPEGERLFILDDDLSRIDIFDGVSKAIPLTDLHGFVNRAFDVTEAFGLRFWGINANVNPLNMEDKISVGLIYLVQQMFGLINSHDPRLMVDIGEMIPMRKDFKAGKESHERVLKYYTVDGGVVKFKYVGAKETYWEEPGGLAVSRTNDGELNASQILIREYPGLVEYREFNGWHDLKFVGGKTKTYPKDITIEEIKKLKLNQDQQTSFNPFV